MDFYKEWLGIPDGPRPPDHYELLRCKRFEDDIEKLRGHYKKLNTHVRKYATGKYSNESQSLLNEMAKAMLCLTDSERKQEYDESLGREFPANKDIFGRIPLLDVLVKTNKISRDQKREVESFAQARGLSIRDAVVQMKLTEPDEAARALAKQLGYPYIDLEDMLPEEDILDLVPKSLVKKYSVIPLFVDDGRLLVACVDEPEHEVEEELRLRYGVPIRPVLAVPRAVNQAIAKYYAPGARDEAKSLAVATPTGKGKKAAKASPTAAASAPKAGPDNRRFDQLNADEQANRKNIGIIAMLWGFMIPMLPQVIQLFKPTMVILGFWPNVGIAATICLMACWYVTQKYWR